jgi:hypothetical protein
MTSIPKILGQIKPNTNALTLLYKAPTNVSYTSLSILNVCNIDGTTNRFSITVAQGDVAANSSQYIYANAVVNAYSTVFATAVMSLAPNDAIYVSTTQNSSVQIQDAVNSGNTANLSISVSAGSPNVTGINTNFTTLTPGSYILVTGATPSTQQIINITNATSLVAAANYTTNISGSSAYILGFGNVTYSLSGMEMLAPPVITGISVAKGPIGGGTTTVITGKYFTGATAVKFGGSYANSFVINSDTQITAVSPATSYASVVDLYVINNGGTSATCLADQFTYFYPTPVVTSVVPNTGSRFANTQVIITGSGFTQTQTVVFGDTYASFNVDSDTQITTISPYHGVAETVNILLKTSGAASSNVIADQFTYT